MVILSFFITILVIFLLLAFTTLMTKWINNIVTPLDKNFIKYGYANHKTFKRELSKVEIDPDKFSKYNKLMYSSKEFEFKRDTIAFNGKHMIIHNPLSYLIVLIEMNKLSKNSNPNRPKKIKW